MIFCFWTCDPASAIKVWASLCWDRSERRGIMQATRRYTLLEVECKAVAVARDIKDKGGWS